LGRALGMQTKAPHISGNFARTTRGSEVAEFAMVLPILFLLVIGIYWFGQAFLIYGTITNAARDGARAAVNPACTTCSEIDPTANAWATIQNDLQAAHINPNALQRPTNPPAVCGCSPTGLTTGCSSSTVPCDRNQNNICVQGVNHTGRRRRLSEDYIQLSSTTAPTGNNQAGGAGECGISVSFQYPYKFWLPGTSLNNQTVNLQAQAQMRAESQ
jgi:Flp pilus assembly protein TadG